MAAGSMLREEGEARDREVYLKDKHSPLALALPYSPIALAPPPLALILSLVL